jgi:hypothetical protein
MALATARNAKQGSHDHSATGLYNRMIPARTILDILGATWPPSAPVDPRYALGPGERELMWHANGQLVAFTTSSLEWEGSSAVWAKAEPLRAALSAHGLAIWAWSLGEKSPGSTNGTRHQTEPKSMPRVNSHPIPQKPGEAPPSTPKHSGLPAPAKPYGKAEQVMSQSVQMGWPDADGWRNPRTRSPA